MTRWLPITFALLSAAPLVGAEGAVDFVRDVAPLFERSCVRCHQPANKKGDLSLATAADLLDLGYLVPGKPNESHLLDVVTAGADGRAPTMPKEGQPLTADEVAIVRRWIAAGAVWPSDAIVRERSKADRSWWSLQPLKSHAPPSPPGLPTAWSTNPIDRFVFQKLAEAKLEPSPPADSAALCRRLHFDLTGLPPTAEELAEFVRLYSMSRGLPVSSPIQDKGTGRQGDKEADYASYVDRLLASPHYGEHWGRHWLDVVRFGESNGYERNVIIDNAWPYRDWVIRAVNDDLPFAEFVTAQLAGDVVALGDPRVETGVAFLTVGPYDNVGNQDAVQKAIIRADELDDMVRAVGETFLGFTVGCARCHNHKFDPLPQADYYRLVATLAGTSHGERVLATTAERRARNEAVKKLTTERDRLRNERLLLENSVVDRAEKKPAQYEQAWTRDPTDRHATVDHFTPVEAKFVRLTVSATDRDPHAATGYGIDEFEVWTSGETATNVAAAAQGGRAEGAGRVAEDFADAYGPGLAIDGEFGARWIAAGPTLTITLARPAMIDRVVFSSDRLQTVDRNQSKTLFIGEYVLETSLDGQTWREVASSRDRKPSTPEHRRTRLLTGEQTAAEKAQLAEFTTAVGRLDAEEKKLPAFPVWWLGKFAQPTEATYVFTGGDPQKKAEPVRAASLSLLADVAKPYELDDAAPEGNRRLELARWITSAENPLTPRVMVNRLWHYHFGTGLVATPSDFGYMGSPPSHPELLDWLAREWQRGGGRWKPLHRLIVTSQAYRQSASFRADAARIDADARLLWRFPPRRLSAEELRDSMLLTAGKLNLTMGGPGFRLHKYLQDNVATYVPLDAHGPETYRRAVYHQNARAAPVDLLADFDCPDNAFAAPRRSSTTTPLQALTMLNHTFAVDMADALAARVERDAPSADAASRIDLAFRLTFGRGPSVEERQSAAPVVERFGLRALCRALLNANEFLYVR